MLAAHVRICDGGRWAANRRKSRQGTKMGGNTRRATKTQLDRREVEYVVLHATEMVRFGCDGVEKRHTRDGPKPEVDFFAPQFQIPKKQVFSTVRPPTRSSGFFFTLALSTMLFID